MIIAVVGENAKAAQLVCDQVAEIKQGNVAHWKLAALADESEKTLSKRVDLLAHLQRPRGRALLLVQFITHKREADFIRSKQGFVWHVEGGVSNSIAMKQDDVLVTPKFKKSGVYMAVKEALEHCDLKQKPGNAMPLPSVRWRD